MQARSFLARSASSRRRTSSNGNRYPAHEFRELDNAELQSRLKDAKEELFNLRFQKATGQLTNNRRIGTVKRDIARIYTVLRERELACPLLRELRLNHE